MALTVGFVVDKVPLREIRFSSISYQSTTTSCSFTHREEQETYNSPQFHTDTGLIQHDNKRLVSNYQHNAQFLYSITIYMLHYNPQHVSSSTMLIFRRKNCIVTASGIALNRHTVRLFTESNDTVAAVIQFVLLKMSIVLLETC